MIIPMSTKEIAIYCNCSNPSARTYIDRYGWHRIRKHDKTRAILYEVKPNQLEELKNLITVRMIKWKHRGGKRYDKTNT